MTTRRLRSAMRTDFIVQVRNRLYAIGVAVAALIAVVLARLTTAESLGVAAPVLLVLAVGGSTLLYVAGMILFEKSEGTLNALIVSPLRAREYLLAKLVTLTALATLEASLMVGGAALLLGVATFTTFSIPVLLLGIVLLGLIYTLIGIVIVVRYSSITDFLVPVLGIALILQAPALHFTGLIESYAFYIIPTTAPTLIMAAAWEPIAAWEWLYALGYSALVIGGLWVWSLRAFQRQIVMRVGS